MNWLSAFIASSSPIYLLLFLPVVILFLTKKQVLRIPVPYLSDFRDKGILNSGKARFVIFWCLVAALIIALVSPTIPSLKTVVVHTSEVCERDIVNVYDISGSMQDKKFVVARDALYEFAKNRSSDCFSTILFSGPSGSSYPEKKRGYALLANAFVKDPDELILPLRDGIDKENPGSLLRQFSQGTEISEGLVVAAKFFKEDSTAETKVLILISDLGNDDKDNERALTVLNGMIDRDIFVYVLGVDASKYDQFYKEILALGNIGKLHYFSIRSEDDIERSYEIISRLEPASAPHTRTEIVSVQGLNFAFLWAALALWAIWFILEFRVIRIP